MKNTNELHSKFEREEHFEDLGLLHPYPDIERELRSNDKENFHATSLHVQKKGLMPETAQEDPRDAIISAMRKNGWHYFEQKRCWMKRCPQHSEFVVYVDELYKLLDHNIISHQQHFTFQENNFFNKFAENIEEHILIYRIQREMNQQKSVLNTLTGYEEEQIYRGKGSIISVARKLPKYHHDSKTQIITNENLSQFVNEIIQKPSQTSFSFKLTDDKSDPSTLIVSLTTSKYEAGIFLTRIKQFLVSEISSYNTSKILEDARSFQFDVKFSNNRLGIHPCLKFGSKSKKQLGIWISSLAKDGQAKKLLGASIDKGAVITAMNGVKVYTLADMTEIIKNSNGEHIILTLCMSRYATLKDIHENSISDKNGILIKRLDGTIVRRSSVLHGGQKSGHKDDKVSIDTISRNVARGTQNYNYYRHFAEKFHAARDIEFKNTGILGQSANKSMWKQHKLIFGEKCDDSCPCPSDSRRISQSVVNDYLIKHKKKGTLRDIDPSLRSGENPVGFMNNFVPKFYHKVSNEFPHDSPRQILDRLVSMWSSHKYERRYGLKCKVSCSCIEAWSNIFLKKAHSYEKLKDRDASKLKQISNQQTNSVEQKNESFRSIPKKRAKLNEKEFQIVFNPRKPLGFCCDTQNGKCVITSVCPTAKQSEISTGNIVLASAAVVRGLVEEKKTLDTHLDLKEAYNATKINENTKLRLWFKGDHHIWNDNNQWSETGAWKGDPNEGWPGGANLVHLTNELTLKQRQEKKIAERQRYLKDGLRDAIKRKKSMSSTTDRSAQMKSLVPSRSHATGKSNKHKLSPKLTNKSLPSRNLMDKNHTHTNNYSAVIVQQDYPDTKSSTNENKIVPLQSSLRSSKKFTKEKRGGNVTFATELVQTKLIPMYVDQKENANNVPSTLMHERVPQTVSQSNDIQRKTSTILEKTKCDSQNSNHVKVPTLPNQRSEINDMVFIKNYAEVIDLLYIDNQSAKSTQLKKNLLIKVKETKNQYLKDIEKSTSNVDEMKEKKVDIEFKEKALKIFIQAEYVIKMANSLNDWLKIEYAPLSVKDVHLSKDGKSNSSENFLFCEIFVDRRKSYTHMVPFNSNVSWMDQGKLLIQSSEFNPKIGHNMEDRKIVIELLKGVISGDCITLGSWHCNLIELASKLKDSQKQVIQENLRKSHFILDGSIVVEVRSLPFDEKDRKIKINQVRKELTALIDWITTFEKETSKFGRMKGIDLNMSFASCGNLSLLHAAVYLGDTLSIKRLFKMGADPYARSFVGNALTLTENLYNIQNPASQEKRNKIVDILGEGKSQPKICDAVSYPRNKVLDKGAQDMTTTYCQSENQCTTKPDNFISSRNNSKQCSSRNTDDTTNPSIRTSSLVNEYSNNSSPPFIQEAKSRNVTKLVPEDDFKEPGKKIGEKLSSKTDEIRPLSGNKYNKQSHQKSIDIGELNVEPAEPKQENHSDSRNEMPTFAGAKFRNLSFLAQSSFGNCKLESEDQPGVDQGSPNKSSLPALESPYWVDDKHQRCSYFGSSTACRYGKNCKMAHINPRLGDKIHDTQLMNKILNEKVYYIPISLKNFRVIRRSNKEGIMWFSAAYVDPETSVIYKAENKDGLECEVGEFWYENEHAAQTAAKHVYLLAKYFDGQLHNEKKRKHFSADTPFDNKRWKSEQTTDSIFNALVKQTNLQNIFVKIHPEYQLKRTCWTLKQARDRNGYYTAILKSPVPSERNISFFPSECGGTLIDGEWYYKDQLHAKAATLVNYISHYKRKSLITEDLVNVSTGKKIL